MRILTLASSASCSGSVTPESSASSIARADFEYVVDATLESLIPASWRTFSSRWIVRPRSLLCALRKPGQIPQPADLRWRHEARADQPVLHELADPLRVLDVGLAAGDVAQVMRVQAASTRTDPRAPGTPSSSTRRWPPSRPASRRPRPATQRAPRVQRASSLNVSCLLIPAATTAARHPDGRHHIVAMHIETRAPLHHHIHRPAPFETTVDMSPGGGLPRMSLTYALAAAINGPTGPRATLSHGL